MHVVQCVDDKRYTQIRRNVFQFFYFTKKKKKKRNKWKRQKEPQRAKNTCKCQRKICVCVIRVPDNSKYQQSQNNILNSKGTFENNKRHECFISEHFKKKTSFVCLLSGQIEFACSMYVYARFGRVCVHKLGNENIHFVNANVECIPELTRR